MIKLTTVGKTKEPYLQTGEQDFINRINRYATMTIQMVKPEKVAANRNSRIVIENEGKRILAKIDPADWVVVLDNQGKQLSSEGLAQLIQQRMNSGIRCIHFIIGGPLGLDDNVLKRANTVLSLSKMTFTHEMVRLIILEQIYRAFTIMNGEKYHK